MKNSLHKKEFGVVAGIDASLFLDRCIRGHTIEGVTTG